MHYRLYNLLCWILLLVGTPLFILYGLITGKQLGSIRERFGFSPLLKEIRSCPKDKRLWFHAASVGEVQVAKSIITETAKLIPEASFVLSTVTKHGQLVAKEQMGGNVTCIYAPIDLPWVAKRFIQAIKPAAYICLETELWPNMLKTAAQNGVKLLLLNGRMSENSVKNYGHFTKFTQEVLNYFSVISCITNRDRDRFARLGAIPPKLQVNGNAKYDNIVLPFNEIEKYYRNKLDIKPSDTTFIAGSTHEGEEEQLISVYKTLRQMVPGMIMIIAPRHIIRVNRIAALFEAHNLEYQLYSRLAGENRRQDLILVDTIGELKNLYSIATYVFCGGSLVPKGGHNIMEPASWGKPVLYGPNMNDFKDAQYLLESAQVGFAVKDSQEICDQILYFHNNQNKYKETSTKAFKVIADQSGSAKRQARIIRDFL